MSMTAQHESKCMRCKKSIKPGDTISKKYDHWCSDESCVNTPTGSKPKESSATVSAPKDKPLYQQVHKEVWEFALDQAHVINKDDPANKTGTIILAQVIYKKCMDFNIHMKGNKTTETSN